MPHRTTEPGGDPAAPRHPQHPRTRRAAPMWVGVLFLGAAGALTTGYFLLPLDTLGDHPWAGWTLFAVSVTTIAGVLLRQMNDVLQDKPHTHPGLVIPLQMLLSILVFAATYYTLAREPGEFAGLRTKVDALYFTVVTLATVGYGDVAATGQTSRVVVLLQIAYSFIFLTAGATALTRHLRKQLSSGR